MMYERAAYGWQLNEPEGWLDKINGDGSVKRTKRQVDGTYLAQIRVFAA